ncbi:MAG: hypothetical protein RL637_943 [Pseudomonadota bacterium]|jgi:hypothetical protein
MNHFSRLLFSLSLYSLTFSVWAEFNTTVTLNGVTRSYSFPDAESALTVDQASYRNDFKNPQTGALPNNSIGQITQFDFQGSPMTLIRTDVSTLVIAPITGVTTDFISLSGTGLYRQLTNYLASGTLPENAKTGLSATTLANLKQIIQQQVPSSNTGLSSQLTELTNQNQSAQNTATEALTQITQKFANSGVTCDLNRNDALCAKTLPTAAIAGNPASLMGTMVDQIFLQTGDNLLDTQQTSTTHSAQRKLKKNHIEVGLQYGHYELAGASVDTVSLPVSYTARLNSKNQLIFSVPFTYVNTQGNNSYQIGGGVAYRYWLQPEWTLTPAINYAYRGTPDSGNGLNRTEGHIVAGTLTSQYQLDLAQWIPNLPLELSLTDMVGYFQSLNMETNIKGKSYRTSGQVANFVLKNGISLNYHTDHFYWAAFVNNTEFFGSELYFEQYNEVGLAVRPQHLGKVWNHLNVSANYLFSLAKGQDGKLDGFRLNIGYQF